MIPQHGQARPIWEGLRQKFDLLFRQFRLAQEHAGDVAARVRQALHISARNRIVIVGHENDRNGSARHHAGLQHVFRTQRDERIRIGAHHGDRLRG